MHSANALVGTCKMGDASDTMAVVDSALKVSTPSERRCAPCLLFSCGTSSGVKKWLSSVLDTVMAMDTTIMEKSTNVHPCYIFRPCILPRVFANFSCTYSKEICGGIVNL